MGRSKNRTRATVSNRRLRSYNAAPHSFSSAPAVDLGRLSRALRSPSLNSQPYSLRHARTYVTPRTPPTRQPPRSRPPRVRSSRAMSAGVWHEVGNPVSAAPAQSLPDETLVCVRRSQRREVLHALQKTGSAGQKSPKYNRLSKIHCKK